MTEPRDWVTQPGTDVADLPRDELFECPYDYRRFGPDRILLHIREQHPNLWPSVRHTVGGYLGYVDRRYNGPATD